ncbi:hypothetical protein [Streptomyces sp. NPDC057280]|uniref:hypothetical protein n=1 Tax=Streptomyces sp. NPDC057280 TaxID=3346081 RepID=UPI0036390E38
MPRSVRLAMVGVRVRALLSLAAGALLLSLVSDAVGHGGGEGAGLLRSGAMPSVPVALALVLCGALSGRQAPNWFDR